MDVPYLPNLRSGGCGVISTLHQPTLKSLLVLNLKESQRRRLALLRGPLVDPWPS
jgi:hypothetical protein